jgi:catechol 2,3-dioxygenase-like lactoylglutathione lyase family enzyme
MRLSHISLTARNADQLAAFYRKVFGFKDLSQPKRLSWQVVSRGNGLPGSEIYAIWLQISEDGGPFLEIMEYSETVSRPIPAVNEPGFGHLAFTFADLKECVKNVLTYGGSLQGEIVNFGTEKRPCLIVYVRDPEGNILELEDASERQTKTL